MAEPALAAQLIAQDLELLALLAAGLPVEAVARRVNASERTVRRRVRAIRDRLGCATTIQAIVWATRQGLV